jgi:hypothetical protein
VPPPSMVALVRMSADAGGGGIFVLFGTKAKV